MSSWTMLKNEESDEMKESEVSLPSTTGWRSGVDLRSIVERGVSNLQRQHADTGVPLPRVVVDVPCSQRFEGDAGALTELLSVWLQDAVRAAAGNAAMARTAEVLITSVEYPDCVEIEIADSGPSLAERRSFAGGVVGQVHLSARQELLEQVRGNVRLDNCAEGGVAVTLRVPRVVSRRMAA